MARRKRDVRITQSTELKNYVRGSTTPYAAVSKIRGRIPSSELSGFIAWLPSVRRNSRGIFSGLYPANIGELRRLGNLDRVSLEREVAWAGNLIRQHAAQMSAFVAAATDYEEALVTGRLDDCRVKLDGIDRQFGFSLWSIEIRLALVQLAGGLEAQKAYVAQVRENPTVNDLVSVITYYISQRNEPTTTPMRFNKEMKDRAAAWKISPSFRTYLLFRIINQPMKNADEFAASLQNETGSALVDQYDTFVRLAQQAAVFGDTRVQNVFVDELRLVAREVDDERIRRALFLMTAEESWLSVSKIGDTVAENAAISGDPVLAYQSGAGAVERNPLDVSLWIGQARSAVSVGDEVDGGNTICQLAVDHARRVVGKLEGVEKSVIALMKDGLNYHLLGFAPALEDLVLGELSSDPAHLPSAMLAFLRGRYLRPSDMACLSTREQRLAMIAALEFSFKNSVSYRYEIIRADLVQECEIVNWYASTSVEISIESKLDASIGRALIREEYETALVLSREYASITKPTLKYSVARYICYCLLKLNRVGELVEFVAKSCIEYPEFAHFLPVEECAHRLDKETRRQLAGNLSVPIILDLFSKRFDDRLDDVRGYAYEDFLIAHGLERPSQLNELALTFDGRLLTYYLRFICNPEIMQVSSVFRGTRELEEERKIVLSLLVKLDSENAKEYETELRDLTRAQLIHRGVRQVERSKIYVDVVAIRRMFEKKHKETYQRYQSLLKAGLGMRDTGLVEALHGALSGTPLPQEFLEIPKDEANDLLLQMLRWVFDECTKNPEHGLDCYLSMRIRHGTLSGQLRTPLEVEKIITQRAVGTDEYEQNHQWLTQLPQVTEESRTAIDTRLARFSADYDALISRVANELIQIRSSERPRGLFRFGVLSSVRFRLWVEGLTADMNSDAFFDRCLELFWESVETSLETVRRVIDEQLKPEITLMFGGLEADIERLADGAPTANLDRAVRTAQTGAQQALDLVKDWFRLSQPITEPNFPIEDLIDVGLQCVHAIHRDFVPQVVRNVPRLPPFAGALVLFSDIFFIIFDNIRRHSGVGAVPHVQIDITDKGDRLSIYTRNEVAPGTCTDRARARIDRIKEAIATGEYQKAVSSEGGTGLIKLRKLVGNGEKSPRHLDFGFEIGNFFFVELEIGKREIQL